MSDIIIPLKQCDVIIHYCDGYNNHTYGICYNNANGMFLGEVEDFWRWNESTRKKQLQAWLDERWDRLMED